MSWGWDLNPIGSVSIIKRKKEKNHYLSPSTQTKERPGEGSMRKRLSAVLEEITHWTQPCWSQTSSLQDYEKTDSCFWSHLVQATLWWQPEHMKMVTLGMAESGQISARCHGNRINRIWHLTHFVMWEAKVNSDCKPMTRRCSDTIYGYREQKGKNSSEGAELNFCFYMFSDWTWGIGNITMQSLPADKWNWVWWLREMPKLKI